MFKAVGYEVLELKRITYGKLNLDIEEGDFREVSLLKLYRSKMVVERMAYIVYFKVRKYLKLNGMDVHVAYVSKRANYAIVYVDKAKGDKVLTQALSNVKDSKCCSFTIFR